MKRKEGPHAASTRGACRTAIARRLLAWYEQAKRDLPWRRDSDPYRVWVSEVMLQQTRVEVVVPRYGAFLDRFPDIRSLARAGDEQVLAAWSGLGYYRRARALHAAAVAIVDRHGGELPRSREELLALPGFGEYTAGAVLSIAFNLPEPILDGNVARVLTRIDSIDGDPRRGPLARRLRERARELIPEGRASSFNQALMELGALVCIPGRPRCAECPLKSLCSARRAGDPTRFPALAPRRRAVAVDLTAAVVSRGDRYLLERRGDDGPSYLRGLWGFPLADGKPPDGVRDIRKRISTFAGVRWQTPESLGVVRHSITFRRIALHAVRFETKGKCLDLPVRNGGAFAWHEIDRLGRDLPASSLALKVKALLDRSSTGPDAR